MWEKLLKLGQLQILRCHIMFSLMTRCQFQSRHLAQCLNNFNNAVIATLASPKGRTILKSDSPLLYDLGQYLEYAGISNPLEKVYTSENVPPYLLVLIWLTFQSNMSKMSYIRSIGSLSGKRQSDASDGHPLMIGTLTLLRQWPLSSTNCEYFTRLLWLQVSMAVQQTIPISVQASKAANHLSVDAQSWLAFLDEWKVHCENSNMGGNSSITQVNYLVDTFQTLGTK